MKNKINKGGLLATPRQHCSSKARGCIVRTRYNCPSWTKPVLLRNYEGTNLILNRQTLFLHPSVCLEMPCPLFLGADVPAALPRISVKSHWFSPHIFGYTVVKKSIVHSCSSPIITSIDLACAIPGFQNRCTADVEQLGQNFKFDTRHQ